jgi:hypothetical protein
MPGLVVTAMALVAREPLVFVLGFSLLLPGVVGVPALWLSNSRASQVHREGEVEVFAYSPLLLYGWPVYGWCFAATPLVLFLTLGSVANWGWGVAVLGLSALLLLGAFRTTKQIRQRFAEIRVASDRIEAVHLGGARTVLAWSEIARIEAAPFDHLAGHGVSVVGENASILIYGKIRGIRQLKRRLFELAAEHGLSTNGVSWNSFGLVTEADRI